MYEDERIYKVEIGKVYKMEILEDFISRFNYHLYIKSKNKYSSIISKNAECIVKSFIIENYQFLYLGDNGINIKSVKGVIIAELS